MTSIQTAGMPALLPVPREYHPMPGVCGVGLESSIETAMDEPRVEQRIREWLSRRAYTKTEGHHTQRTRIRVAVDRHRVTHAHGYSVRVQQGEIEIVGGSPAGCFHAWTTIEQLAIHGRTAIPCCRIVDWPDFRTRGLLHDVTRGKVPTLETLKLLVDRLAALKANQLQLYVEHAFSFSFDPRICGPDEGLTPDDVRALDHYCRDRFIDLVPALATFGHMGRILSIPDYRHLAEVETSTPWEAMSWPDRARGLTLDCMNPAARQLVENLWADVLDAFSSPVVNICGDEPWNLGKGKNRELLQRDGAGIAYVEQIRRTHNLCAARGRRSQVWGDVVRTYPHLLDRIPKDSTLLHWGYDDDADYEGTAGFVASGMDVIVCPGTSGWKRIINAMNLAERNIAVFAAAGVRHGAAGLLNTDWGDHGHFNTLACSWHGIALGAALAWRADHPTGRAFDERFAPLVLGLGNAECVSLLRDTCRAADMCETWRLLWMPLDRVAADPSLPSAEALASMKESAIDAKQHLDRYKQSVPGDRRDGADLSLACTFTELFAERAALAAESVREKVDSLPSRDRERAVDAVETGPLPYGRGSETLHTRSKRAKAIRPVRETRRAGADWADRLQEASGKYAEHWRVRNKPCGLQDILTALAKVGDEMRDRTT